MNSVKCPPYCRSNCATKHHPLLVAVLNCVDTLDEKEVVQKLANLKQAIEQHCQEHEDYSLDDEIPDHTPAYRHPLLHWASSLGRISVVSWLVKNGFSKIAKNNRNGDTAIHRALLTLQETCPADSTKKFQELLVHLDSALLDVNIHGNTALHMCCEMLVNCMPRIEFYVECVTIILDQAQHKGKEFLQKLLDVANHEGNTALHILVKSERFPDTVKELVQAGASLDIKNIKDKTVYDLVGNATLTWLRLYSMTSQNELKGEAANSKNTESRESSLAPDDATTEETDSETSAGPKIVTRTLYDKSGALIGVRVTQVKEQQEHDGDRQQTEVSVDTEDTALEPPLAKLQKMSEVRTDSPIEQLSGVDLDVLNDIALGVGKDLKDITPDSPASMEMGNIDNIIATTSSDTKETAETVLLADITEKQDKDVKIDLNCLPDGALILIKPGQTLEDFVATSKPNVLARFGKIVRKEFLDCNMKLSGVQTKVEAHNERIEEIETQQGSSMERTQELLAKLSKVQDEEESLRKQTSVVQGELDSTQVTLNGLIERLQHCQAALDALDSIF